VYTGDNPDILSHEDACWDIFCTVVSGVETSNRKSTAMKNNFYKCKHIKNLASATKLKDCHK